jgi:hydroxymethylglutaryl-CoA lyase
MGMPATVVLREVGPRDGLQSEAPVPVEVRVELVDRLFAAGLRDVEVAAFVSPAAVPAMAGAAEVVARIRRPPGATVTALVPNRKGAELALAAGVDVLTATISVSETYNLRNVRMTTAQSLEALSGICELATVPVDAVVSCAFGSPYEGDAVPADVAALGTRLRDAGVARLTFADTTGMATPRRVDELLDATGTDIGLHLHESRGTALVNAYAALQRGVHRFDVSVCGLGGSPFAAGAGGNLATEELVAVLDDLDVESGVDVEELIAVGSWLQEELGHPVPSRVLTAGPRTRRAS